MSSTSGLSLKDLLRRALTVGALEVRLVPGRRTVVVTAAGENEVRGDPQTPESIRRLLEPVLTIEARRALPTGWAEWEFELDACGIVQASVELKVGLAHASFFLGRCQKPGEPPRLAAARAAPPPPAAEVAPPRPAPSSFTPEEADIGVTSVPIAPPPPAPVPAGPAQALPTEPPVPLNRRAYDVGVSSGSSASIDALLEKMLAAKASDLHISAGAAPMLRRDGEMESMPGEKVLTAESVQRMLWPVVPPRNREEFGDTQDTDFAYELPGKARFRVNLFVDLKGMGAVLRVIPSKILTVDDLKLPRSLLSLCKLSKGLVLVTGPTGSGKSTTLAALVDYINSTRSQHIITIEDPVEFVHSNKKCLVNQRQVGEHTKTFKAALRAALREDPDIVLLGEMRDLETVSIALETAETGHLVFGTLHTSSAPSTIDRIIDQFPSGEQGQIRTMLSGSLKGVIAQMLCKRIGGGRVAALEVMFGVPAISNLIREQKAFQIPSVMQTGKNLGMSLMNDSLLALVKERVVAPEEALGKAYDKAGLISLFKNHQIPVSSEFT